MYRVNGRVLRVALFFCTPRLSSIRAGDQSLMRVLLRFGADYEEPPLVLVGLVVSGLYMRSGGLAVGLAGKDCSTTPCAVAKGMCFERPSCQRGKIRTPYAVTADVCTLDRQAFYHQPLPRRWQVQ